MVSNFLGNSAISTLSMMLNFVFLYTFGYSHVKKASTHYFMFKGKRDLIRGINIYEKLHQRAKVKNKHFLIRFGYKCFCTMEFVLILYTKQIKVYLV